MADSPVLTAHPVGAVSDFANDTRRFVTIGGVEIGVIEYEGSFYAYQNICPHMGGPVCEGVLMGKVEVSLDDLGRAGRSRFSSDEIHLACPWHGTQFDLRTGECVSNSRRLRKFEVVQRDDRVYVLA